MPSINRNINNLPPGAGRAAAPPAPTPQPGTLAPTPPPFPNVGGGGGSSPGSPVTQPAAPGGGTGAPGTPVSNPGTAPTTNPNGTPIVGGPDTGSGAKPANGGGPAAGNNAGAADGGGSRPGPKNVGTKLRGRKKPIRVRVGGGGVFGFPPPAQSAKSHSAPKIHWGKGWTRVNTPRGYYMLHSSGAKAFPGVQPRVSATPNSKVQIVDTEFGRAKRFPDGTTIGFLSDGGAYKIGADGSRSRIAFGDYTFGGVKARVFEASTVSAVTTDGRYMRYDSSGNVRFGRGKRPGAAGANSPATPAAGTVAGGGGASANGTNGSGGTNGSTGTTGGNPNQKPNGTTGTGAGSGTGAGTGATGGGGASSSAGGTGSATGVQQINQMPALLNNVMQQLQSVIQQLTAVIRGMMANMEGGGNPALMGAGGAGFNGLPGGLGGAFAGASTQMANPMYASDLASSLGMQGVTAGGAMTPSQINNLTTAINQLVAVTGALGGGASALQRPPQFGGSMNPFGANIFGSGADASSPFRSPASAGGVTADPRLMQMQAAADMSALLDSPDSSESEGAGF